jgi:suppressor for copper-sensitivity B
MITVFRCLLLAAVTLSVGLPATFAPALAAEGGAASSTWARSEQAEVRLVSAVTATGDAGELPLGLEFRLKPGWKVYWRNAGDAGYPPKAVFAGDNVQGSRMSWPVPHRFQVLGLQSFGYADHVIYPIALAVAKPGQPLAARAEVEYLTCAEICVPQQASLTLALPAGPAMPSLHATEIGRFAASVPGDGSSHGLRVVRGETWGSGDSVGLRVTVEADPPLSNPDLFIESADNWGFGPPRVTLEKGGRRAILTAAGLPGTIPESLVGKPVTVTVGEGARGAEQTLTLAAGVPTTLIPERAGLAAMVAVALLGGLILNLMPCVLPVLSLKVLGMIGHGGGERGFIRLSFLASSAGIVLSFLALAAAAVTVKQAGLAVGWGIQFQQPLFLVFLTLIVTLFAANLWGLFEVPLPQWASGLGSAGGSHSLGGHFLTGAFATLLATPCSAPFLGTAIGFALGQGPIEVFTIFGALGVGMALPYLGIAAWPGLAQRLPKPGAWMIRVRQGLGVALGLTAAWLVWVLAAQTSSVAAGAVAGLMVALIALLAVRDRLPEGLRPAAAGGVAVAAAMAFVPPLQASAGLHLPTKNDAAWARFDRSAIDRLVAEGRTVFVDVTADWCITCQVNKAAVVNRGEVAKRLKRPDTVAMRADWTNPDDSIAAYLAGNGRYGIPFNAVYGPGAPEGVLLPELLSEGVVMEAFEKAARPKG